MLSVCLFVCVCVRARVCVYVRARAETRSLPAGRYRACRPLSGLPLF